MHAPPQVASGKIDINIRGIKSSKADLFTGKKRFIQVAVQVSCLLVVGSRLGGKSVRQCAGRLGGFGGCSPWGVSRSQGLELAGQDAWQLAFGSRSSK